MSQYVNCPECGSDNIEKVGFGHWASGWAEYRFGRVKRWITYAQMGAAPEAAALAAQPAWK